MISERPKSETGTEIIFEFWPSVDKFTNTLTFDYLPLSLLVNVVYGSPQTTINKLFYENFLIGDLDHDKNIINDILSITPLPKPNYIRVA